MNQVGNPDHGGILVSKQYIFTTVLTVDEA